MPVPRGRHTIVVYPAEQATDTYGNTVWRPSQSSTGITVRNVSMNPKPSVDRRTGDVRAGRQYLLLATEIPQINAHAQIEWRGCRFNVIGEPRRWDISAGTRHVEVDLMEEH